MNMSAVSLTKCWLERLYRRGSKPNRSYISQLQYAHSLDLAAASCANRHPIIKDSVSDQEKSIDLRKGVIDYAAACATDLEPPGGWLFVETLNGVESSLPPGKCQADVYQPLRLPAILVSDGKYGLDETMGAFEALRRRDYDVQSVLIFKDPAENHLRIAKRFDELGITNLSLRKLPEPHPVPQKDTRQMKEWYSGVARSNAVKDLLCGLYDRHNQRAKELAAGDKLAQAFETIPEDGSARGSKLRFSFAVPGKHKHCV